MVTEKLLKGLQQHHQASTSEQKRRACEQLMRLIPQLPYVYKNGDRRYNREDFQDAYQLMCLNLYQGGIDNLLKYLDRENVALTPEYGLKIQHSFVGLCNRILKCRNLDLQKSRKPAFSFDQPLTKEGQTLGEIYLDPDQSDPWELLWQEELYSAIANFAQAPTTQRIHIQDNPAANLGMFILARYDEQSWQTIAEQTNVPIGSVTALFHRQKPLLRQNFAPLWYRDRVA